VGTDLFDDRGPAVHLAERTRLSLQYAYGKFLAFLSARHCNLLARAPLTASQPIFSAFSRTEVHLWITLIPAALRAGIYCSGLRPAVSTAFTPPSRIAAIYSG
jgi:hypothetical protein